MSAFARWFIISLSFAVAIFWGWYTKVVQQILAVDVTHMTSVAVILLVLVSFYLGIHTYRLDGYDMASQRKALRVGQFVSAFNMSIGLLGTVIGLILMLQTQNAGVSVSDPSAMMAMVGTVMASLGTALYTTAVGIGTAMVIQLQCFNLEEALNDYE